MPRSGLDFTKHFLCAPAKLLLGDETRQRGYPDFSKAAERRALQHVGDRLPDSHQFMKEFIQDDDRLAAILVRRAEACLTPEQHANGKNELVRFERPDFSVTYNAVVKSTERLTVSRLQELQERQILIKAAVGPALYIRYNPEMPRYIYVGTTLDVNSRNNGHCNSWLYLWDVFSLPNLTTALGVENKTHTWLQTIGESARENTRGLFIVNKDLGNARSLVRNFLRTTYDFLFHNSAHGVD